MKLEHQNMFLLIDTMCTKIQYNFVLYRPYAKPDDPVLPELPTIVNIAKKYNKSPGQILIAFQVIRLYLFPYR